ncbi:hypothetical protein RHMOL_Rhmol13G0067800 [Rhododendron molle]|uniref:Uncharacterized protein n=1 Tax=Rhododendron molle TaxID=49168 RepID=A0ACC0L4C0_RHOML|nr:hypothetical protein RHMOL_Rhmol13G0067800 [Rhododendron molle]
MAISGSRRRCPPTSSMMHLLPYDCLCYIFQLLDCKSDRDSFGLTCCLWLQVQNSSRQSLYCPPFVLSPDTPSKCVSAKSKLSLDRFLSRFRLLRSLSLSGCDDLPDSGLSSLQFYGSKLHFLRLDFCSSISDYGLSLVAAGCPCLTIISLFQCKISNVGLQILSKSCSALKDVNLSECFFITDKGIRALSQNCSQLRSVSVKLCGWLTGVGFDGCSETLSWLDASYCRVLPDGGRGIVSGGGLEYLRVSCLSDRCDCIYKDHGLATIGSSGLAKRLAVLDFQRCACVNDETVVAIAKGCPMLQEWSFASCYGVKIPGWESVGANCCNLKRLHVNNCRNLCDQGLQALRDGCKRLEILYVHGCDRISSTAMEVFKSLRGDVKIKEKQVFSIAPSWPFPQRDRTY